MWSCMHRIWSWRTDMLSITISSRIYKIYVLVIVWREKYYYYCLVIQRNAHIFHLLQFTPLCNLNLAKQLFIFFNLRFEAIPNLRPNPSYPMKNTSFPLQNNVSCVLRQCMLKTDSKKVFINLFQLLKVPKIIHLNLYYTPNESVQKLFVIFNIKKFKSNICNAQWYKSQNCKEKQ